MNDTAAILTTANPAYGIWERVALGLPTERVIDIRIEGTIMALAGLGIAYGYGRELFQEKIDKISALLNVDSKNKYIGLRDTIYSLMFGTGFVLIYTETHHRLKKSLQLQLWAEYWDYH